jgi:hypothetical protein
MPSDAPPQRTSGWLSLALVAVTIVAARLPFLLAGTRFFDSDEAVEGLMARHVWSGELPLFLWGQHYKGVPEVYATAAVFHAWAPGVVAMKAVTLAAFALCGMLNFVLLTRLFSRRVAWLGTALLIAAPPSLVLWSLSGSADIVMTFLAGTSLLLGIHAWSRTGSRAGLACAAAALGFGLWIQQYILYYVAAVIVSMLVWTPDAWTRVREFALANGAPRWIRIAVRLPVLAACVYILLGLLAFLGLGFAVTLPGLVITIGDPQKMWWIAAALLLISVAALTAIRLTLTRAWPVLISPALAFLAGYSPMVAARLIAGGPGSPRARMDLAGLVAAMPDVTRIVVPILFGFRSPTTVPLAVPAWFAVAIVAALLFSYAGVTRAQRDPADPLGKVFHVFLILTPVVYIASGSYFDAQSYRYLMPLHAALPAVYAVGVDSLLRSSRAAGVVLLIAVVGVFAYQQADWYRLLEPDVESTTILDCLRGAGVRAAYADYWLSYKLTFISGEQVIVSPVNGVDRYPPYTEFVRAQASAPTIQKPPVDAACDAVLRFP